MRELGLEPEPPASWEIGAAVREEWRKETGELPEKRLKTKTSGSGSHCFAVYPRWFHPTIVRIIGLHQTFKAAQGDLFGPTGERND